MKNNTKYQGGYSAINMTIKWFWEVLEEFDDKLKASFMLFISGSFKVPLGGFKELGFEIQKSYDKDSLPVAHTCFNSLDLPEYESKEILKDKLTKAILEGNESFGIA
jgi:E3 ubiquitin-protein ligase HUWE1